MSKSILGSFAASELPKLGQFLSQVVLGELKSWQKTLRTSKPKTINFQVNDICNARCVMCNIWKRKKDTEISLEAFRNLLQDPFFSAVEHVGITGGEPTLNKDLPKYYEVALETLPQLKSLSFITNGFLPERAIQMYSEVNEQCLARGIPFGGMVSIDGMGEVHDKVRGTKGAFTKATETLFGLREQNIPVIACCTLVKENVYGLHDLLEWGQTNGIYIRFRMAEFIGRLYNDDCSEQIKNFDKYELRHLVSFFYLLLLQYEPDDQIKKTYTSILSMLTGGKRLIGCPYQVSEAINLDCRGRFAHCAPKGAFHPLHPEAYRSVAKHTLERSRIRLQHCSSCIHDYHADWVGSQSWLLASQPRYEQMMYSFADQEFPAEELPSEKVNLNKLNKILLVGWYGTETAGDIAILAGIVREYLAINPRLQFILFSLFPYYTRLTVSELEPELSSRLKVLSYHGMQAARAVEACEAIVMAGGPLMDISQTRLIASLFLMFYRQGKPRIIEGCGIGPLNVNEYRQNVINVVKLASKVTVRDHASHILLQSFNLEKEITVRDDPSRVYINDTGIFYARSKNRIIRCFLRELTAEYPQAISPAEATQNLVIFLTKLTEWYPDYRIELWPMHYFPVGNDDRVYADKLAKLVASDRIFVEWHPRLPREILEAMAEAEFSVCMRFHSVVFAATIGAPFIAVDYTAGGKVRGFLEDNNLASRGFNLDQIPHVEKKQITAILAGQINSEDYS